MTSEEKTKWIELEKRLAQIDYQLCEAITTESAAEGPFAEIVKEMLALGGEFEDVARDLMRESGYTLPEE